MKLCCFELALIHQSVQPPTRSADLPCSTKFVFYWVALYRDRGVSTANRDSVLGTMELKQKALEHHETTTIWGGFNLTNDSLDLKSPSLFSFSYNRWVSRFSSLSPVPQVTFLGERSSLKDTMLQGHLLKMWEIISAGSNQKVEWHPLPPQKKILCFCWALISHQHKSIIGRES